MALLEESRYCRREIRKKKLIHILTEESCEITNVPARNRRSWESHQQKWANLRASNPYERWNYDGKHRPLAKSGPSTAWPHRQLRHPPTPSWRRQWRRTNRWASTRAPIRCRHPRSRNTRARRRRWGSSGGSEAPRSPGTPTGNRVLLWERRSGSRTAAALCRRRSMRRTPRARGFRTWRWSHGACGCSSSSMKLDLPPPCLQFHDFIHGDQIWQTILFSFMEIFHFWYIPSISQLQNWPHTSNAIPNFPQCSAFDQNWSISIMKQTISSYPYNFYTLIFHPLFF